MNKVSVAQRASEPSNRHSLMRNLRAVLLLRGAQRFMLIAPILVPFFGYYGQDIQQIFWLESFYALTVLIMEVPSGYLADRYGRVAVLRAGGVFWSLSWLLLLGVDDFSGLVVFELFGGFGAALLSGADLALLFDTERELAQKGSGRPNRAVRNLYVIGMVAEGAASLSATGLLLYGGVGLVIAVQTGCGLLVLMASLFLSEPTSERQRNKTLLAEFQTLCEVLLALWRQSAFMRRLLAVLCSWPVIGVLAIWLMQRVWVELELGLVHFGWIWCLLQVVGAVAGHVAHDAERLIGPSRVIYLIVALALAGLLMLGASDLALALLGSVLLFAARGFFSVLFMDAMNRRIESEYRATINSLLGFGFRLGFVVSAGLLGWVFAEFGLWITVFFLTTMTLTLCLTLMLPLAYELSAQSAPDSRS